MDLLCFSHLRWGFVFQRPNHLMSRSARDFRSYFIEEPIFTERGPARMELRTEAPNLFVCTPHLPQQLAGSDVAVAQRALLDELIREQRIEPRVLWFYSPMALAFARHLRAPITVYDCMDELSAFAGAPGELPELERELFARAQLVFTGGHSLYRAKRAQHERVYAFPSSVDIDHFRKARGAALEPEDQGKLGRPRIGFYGVIDERIDYGLIASIADRRPDWQLVLLGPVAKVDPGALPRRPNLHWLGQKSYAQLPGYLAGWDVAIMPFALNRATRFISPTKTLEYLAAGLPVVSTAIEDVVEPYGRAGVVAIADQESFVTAIDAALAPGPQRWRETAEAMLARTSWDRTWSQMRALVDGWLSGRPRLDNALDKEEAHV